MPSRLRARWTIWQSVEEAGIRPGEILLSFDDGPNPIDDTTSRLLDALSSEGVRGAFCVCGRCIPDAPEQVHRMIDDGHLMVNHTYLHQPFAVFSETALAKEIDGCDAAIANVLQIATFRTQFFRPACGWRTPSLERLLPRLQKRLFPITDFGFDTSMTRHTYPKWIDRTLCAARRDHGGLFVLHDRRLPFFGERHYDMRDRESSAYRGWVPEAIAALIQRFRSEGFRFLDPIEYGRRGSHRPEFGREMS